MGVVMKIKVSALRWRFRLSDHVFYWTCDMGDGHTGVITDTSGLTERPTAYNVSYVSLTKIVHDPVTYIDFQEAKRAALLLTIAQLKKKKD